MQGKRVPEILESATAALGDHFYFTHRFDFDLLDIRRNCVT